MRPSIIASARRRYRLAGEILNKVESMATPQVASETTSATAGADSKATAYFAQLPRPLRTFLQKYPPAPFASYSSTSTSTHAKDANPFLPNKHPVTNSWHDPVYSLRRQSDLYKMAYRFGITHLLPPMRKKFYEEKHETKAPVIGSLRFKLTKSERIAPQRQAEVDAALAKADETIAAARGTKYRSKLDKKSQRAKNFV